MRKDIKKSSYYVWFLGAQEAKGFRGSEFLVPVINNLVEREKEVEPFKVTLQTSYKGLKILQNVPSIEPGKHKGSTKTEVLKHFIPHQAITCVYQEDDIVACILLLYNPFTKCPLHVHVYRCDSFETATLLSSQLQTLVDRPENQKKLSEIEGRLKAKGRARDSESSGGSLSSGVSSQEKIASLYDSLAAELKEKLGTGPILLPPRDYDTVHRQKGDLSDIDSRRCRNVSVVGQLVRGRQSPGSSGIGSDHAPSPEREQPPYLDQPSSSDEEWPMEPYKGGSKKNWASSDVSLPRECRQKSDASDPRLSPSRISNVVSSLSLSDQSRNKLSSSREDSSMKGMHVQSKESLIPRWRRSAENRQRTPSPTQPIPSGSSNLTPKERFKDAKEKFLSLERTEQERMMQIKIEQRKNDQQQQPVIPVFRRQVGRNPLYSKEGSEKLQRASCSENQASNLLEERKYNSQPQMPINTKKVVPNCDSRSNKMYVNEREQIEVHRDGNSYIPYSNSVFPVKSHSHQSKKEKMSSGEQLNYKYIHKGSSKNTVDIFGDETAEKSGMKHKRHQRFHNEHERAIPLERYRSPGPVERVVKKSGRHVFPGSSDVLDEPCEPNSNLTENQKMSHHKSEYSERKRRSIYETTEEERKRSSNELAKEFMRRSFQEQRNSGFYKDGHDSYLGRDIVANEVSNRYRLSYVEPKEQTHEMLQRSNSGAMSPPRVGIAAIHPY